MKNREKYEEIKKKNQVKKIQRINMDREIRDLVDNENKIEEKKVRDL